MLAHVNHPAFMILNDNAKAQEKPLWSVGKPCSR
jgi:hypothetical protein